MFLPWAAACSSRLSVVHDVTPLEVLTTPFRIIGEHGECNVGHTLTDVSHALLVIVHGPTAHKCVQGHQVIRPANVDKSTVRHSQNHICHALRLCAYGIPQRQLSTNKFRIK